MRRPAALLPRATPRSPAEFNRDDEDLRRRAEEGDPSAQAALALRYAWGLGVHQDFVQALIWLRRAEPSGDPFALVALGNFYFSGLAVERDPARSAIYFRRAAEHGLAEAQNNLGFLHQIGAGVEKDTRAARDWYEKAAAQGYAPAHYNLATIAAPDKRRSDGIARALWHLREAARLGHMGAARRLSEIYAQGHGLPKDMVRAKLWAELAMDSGSLAEKIHHDRIVAQMKASEISTAVALVSRCRTSGMAQCE